jgi:cell shape-determining protein MreC
MTYLLKHREPRNSKSKSALILFVFVALLAGIFYLWGSYFAPKFAGAFGGVSNFLSEAGSSIVRSLKFLEPELSLISQNDALKKRISDLEQQLFDYSIIQNENASLRENISLVSPNSKLASIILMPPQTPFDTIYIDRGERDGVYVGAQVLNSERSALGYIEEVYPTSAKVRMFSSPGIKTSAVFLRDGTMVEIEGRGGGSFLLEAPLGFEAVEGDIFLIPGSEDRVLAVARSIKKEETSSFVSIMLRVPLELSGNSVLLVEVR